ncbi:UPF0187-domain-containing protein [Dendrothele bispora CBS 962.96]|uniref:UPF0187-domain-containing protein n=1 Tax=Dendrothele bispora (strain CBS 962.96) TaxID=1314807 RepID=A0A4S8L6Q5_DENBC|nr:UPF0187-domain-containing protein [Dendrothele bispora CBS 962.96]
MNGLVNGKRSFTGHHNLLPAIKPQIPLAQYTQQPAYSLIAWTFGRGSVIWRIWPAVLLHTVFAAAVVTLEERGHFTSLAIPNVMLTVLGVVIGFVISYRAMSGYDRYWMGRTTWSDVIRNSRTIGRLVWFHVPPRLTPKTKEEEASGQMMRSTAELVKVMAEKRMALDLIEGFAVALKHHIRGEPGIYFEDLYDLVRPLHDHDHTIEQKAHAAKTSALPPPSRAHRIASNPSLPKAKASPTPPTMMPSSEYTPSNKGKKSSGGHYADPTIPPINAYGTFPQTSSPRGSIYRSRSHHSLRRSNSSLSSHSDASSHSHHSVHSSHRDLAPGRNPNPPDQDVMGQVDGNLIPFAGVFSSIKNLFRWKKKRNDGYEELPRDAWASTSRPQIRTWTPPIQPRIGSAKHIPTPSHEIDKRGENLPLEILRCLSEWCSVLEDRGTVPGTSLGGIVGCLSAMEETLSALERILTTPLPFVYSVHIRHTVWIYLFFLPFQLLRDFGYYTIPGVTIAAFIYLGFLAAGEEIEQPFGYDENDLDLDMFVREIVHVDVENLKKSPCLNAWLPEGEVRRIVQVRRSMSLRVSECTVVEGEGNGGGGSEEEY